MVRSLVASTLLLVACGPAQLAVPTAVTAPEPLPVAASSRVAPESPTAAAPTPDAAAPAADARGAATFDELTKRAFASYLTAVHRRIHEAYADKRLPALARGAPNDPLNDAFLMTRIELVLDGRTGAIRKMGVVRSSGRTGFDTLVLEAVMTAAPFGESPPPTRSRDGSVYLQWSFYRDTRECSVASAEPFLR